LFWVIIPLVSWSASNNMLENTMMIFTSFSILLFIRAVNENRYLFYFLGGVMLFLGFLTKGFVSLFPLSILLWQTLFRPPFFISKTFYYFFYYSFWSNYAFFSPLCSST
jgi:4-amino-4-deoxy-L-arabinose transferase-like glycosyltransferase